MEPSHPALRQRRDDEKVQSTNDDAQLSKMSCVKLGYFKDDFIHFFVRKPVRRAPLINRGYYSRYAALRDLLLRFLAALAAPPSAPPDGQPQRARQVLSLGAGFDTAFFQLAKEGLAQERYIELDFKEVTARKAAIIARTPELLASLGPPEAVAIDEGAGEVRSGPYCLLPADLRDLGSVEAALEAAGFDFTAPTFVLSECVLVYMEAGQSAQLVQWLGSRLQTAAMAIYEQIRPDDAFGQQMLRNLECRGCPLRGIHGTPDLGAQERRLTEGGWDRAEARTMADIYRRCLDPAERGRTERLELFDEFEEWDLIQAHYCIALGVKDSSGLLEGFGFQEQQPQPALRQQQLPRPPPPPPRPLPAG